MSQRDRQTVGLTKSIRQVAAARHLAAERHLRRLEGAGAAYLSLRQAASDSATRLEPAERIFMIDRRRGQLFLSWRWWWFG